MAGLYKPGDVVAHEGPPITEGDVSMSGEVTVVTRVVMRGS